MKTLRRALQTLPALSTLAALLCVAPVAAQAQFNYVTNDVEILYGPVVNPANGHTYYLLPESSWTAAEAKAIQLGGHLVTINDEAENQWLFDTFSSYGGVGRGLWIGLTDQTQEGVFEWVDGTPLAFTRWGEGEPNDHGGNEDYACIFFPQDSRAPGWNDFPDLAGFFGEIPMNGVVEVGVPARPATLYVWENSLTPGPRYDTWETAAHTIQDAIDAAQPGDTVLVTNGLYAPISADKTIILLSVNGPGPTIIDAGGTNRCVSLGSDALLSGFTLTNGYAGQGEGGGVWCASTNTVVTNCVITGNSAPHYGYGGGASGGTLHNCTFTGNSASFDGGGAYRSTLYNCLLISNTVACHGPGCFHSSCGGGVADGTLYNCTLTGNSADIGGGASSSTLYNCTLTGNVARNSGGGAVGGTLYNCTLTGNSAICGDGTGGGATCSTLYNCTLTGNSAGTWGGGAFYGTLYNCTLTGNNVAANCGGGGAGGGANSSTLNNCIVYFNTAPDGANYADSTFSYSCTTPLPEGLGNIDAEPAFVDAAGVDFHLRFDSPCIDAGTNLSAIVTNDLDGNPRPLDGDGDGIAAFDMGAYERQPPTPAERVTALIEQVLASGLAENRIRPLTATLEAAQGSFARESLGAGVNQLGAFQHKVRAQVAPRDAALAAGWISEAQGIIDAVRASAGLRIKGGAIP